MKTQIFCHNDVLGISADPKGNFINDPTASGQLGMVIATSEIEMTPAAKELIKRKYKREGGSFASLMLTDHGDGSGSVGVLGFGKVLMDDIEIGRTCSLVSIMSRTSKEQVLPISISSIRTLPKPKTPTLPEPSP